MRERPTGLGFVHGQRGVGLAVKTLRLLLSMRLDQRPGLASGALLRLVGPETKVPRPCLALARAGLLLLRVGRRLLLPGKLLVRLLRKRRRVLLGKLPLVGGLLILLRLLLLLRRRRQLVRKPLGGRGRKLLLVLGEGLLLLLLMLRRRRSFGRRQGVVAGRRGHRVGSAGGRCRLLCTIFVIRSAPGRTRLLGFA